MKNRQLRINRLIITMIGVVVRVLLPYYIARLWIGCMPEIFKENAVAITPVLAMWGTGVLALCIIGMVICVVSVTLIFVIPRLHSFVEWVFPCIEVKINDNN